MGLVPVAVCAGFFGAGKTTLFNHILSNQQGLRSAEMDAPQSQVNLKLDPSKFPRRIDLELSEEALRALEKHAAKTRRSVAEIASAIISDSVRE